MPVTRWRRGAHELGALPSRGCAHRLLPWNLANVLCFLSGASQTSRGPPRCLGIANIWTLVCSEIARRELCENRSGGCTWKPRAYQRSFSWHEALRCAAPPPDIRELLKAFPALSDQDPKQQATGRWCGEPRKPWPLRCASRVFQPRSKETR